MSSVSEDHMATTAQLSSPVRVIYFWRDGASPFKGWFEVRDTSVESRLDTFTRRHPDDAFRAYYKARWLLNSGGTDAYTRAISVLESVSGAIVADLPSQE
jgi:hypothetical protein